MGKRAVFYFLLIFSVFPAGGFSQPVVIAHRGAHETAPENSIPAFKKAIEVGAEYIETDVHQTGDSVVVLMHDLSVNRTCRIRAISGKGTGEKKC